ncbi:MAG: molybdenum cofactor biosynthesis protein A [Elusimicrobia bacterium ADurb.Bin231]|nr:MAG: molybdenum cofactor biosynthesis protein A [Elusimicrobia bacterium ADurb.Bin231]
MRFKHLFGPVKSRRLGISLGIDLVPHKTCNLNCVYCECGKTTNFTGCRKEYVSVKEVFSELDEYLGQHPVLDYITFSGAGEPMLHSKIGKISGYIKKKFPEYKLALITNGTLFSYRRMRQEAAKMDIILPSLDAVSMPVFKKINRPCPGILPDKIISGLIRLRQEFKGGIWLEIFIIPGLNDTPSELGLIKNSILKINPDKIQLNALDRPGTVRGLIKASSYKLKSIAKYFGEKSEIIAAPEIKLRAKADRNNFEKLVFGTLCRRPSTIRDLSVISGVEEVKIKKYLISLRKTVKIDVTRMKRGNFYKIVK